MPTNNRLTVALKVAASCLRESNSYLGAQFRRLRTRLGPPVAIKAMAAKLARLVYRLAVNEYQGERRLQLLIDHVLPAER